MANTLPHIELLDAIAAHCAENGMKPTAFGMEAVGDPNFVRQLESGREPRSRVIARVREYIATGITHEQSKAGAAA